MNIERIEKDIAILKAKETFFSTQISTAKEGYRNAHDQRAQYEGILYTMEKAELKEI